MDGAFFDGVILANLHGRTSLHAGTLMGTPGTAKRRLYLLRSAVDQRTGGFFSGNTWSKLRHRVYEYDGGANLGRLEGRITNYCNSTTNPA
jgi:hypothetical protein